MNPSADLPEAVTRIDLKRKLAGRVPAILERKKKILDKFGDRKLSDVTVRQAYGGMRGVRCMITETSAVDPFEGIRFRGHSWIRCPSTRIR